MKQLSREYDLKLPYNERELPNRRAQTREHEITGKISLLYFQHYQALNTVIAEFRTWLPKLRTHEQRTQCLLERLTIESSNYVKERTTRDPKRSVRVRGSSRSARLHEPTSPNLGVKHAPTSSFEMPTDNLPPSPTPAPIQRKPPLKRQRSIESLSNRLRRASHSSNQRGTAASRNPLALRCWTTLM